MKRLCSRLRDNQWQIGAGAILLAVIGLLLLVGCSTPGKQKLLTLFFDGVPQPGQTNQPAIQYDEDGRPLVFNEHAQTNAGSAIVPVFFKHAPYEENNCSECHKSKYSVEMKASQREVCGSCHKESSSVLPAKFVHMPVENSECSACHDAHGSPIAKMLLKPADKLCADCHEGFQEFPSTAKVFHMPVANGECSSCHTPHASEHKGLLIKKEPGLCFECHDDYREKAKFTHSPVANGECSSCHAMHQSEEPGLLLMNKQKLCAECHEEKDLSAKDHANLGGKACLDCHDAHAGEDNRLLKAEFLKLLNPPAKEAR